MWTLPKASSRVPGEQETRDETLRTSAIDESDVIQPEWNGEVAFESVCRQKTENTWVATVDFNFLSKTK